MKIIPRKQAAILLELPEDTELNLGVLDELAHAVEGVLPEAIIETFGVEADDYNRVRTELRGRTRLMTTEEAEAEFKHGVLFVPAAGSGPTRVKLLEVKQ